MSEHPRVRRWIDALYHPQPVRYFSSSVADVLDSDTPLDPDSRRSPTRSPKRKRPTNAPSPSPSPGKSRRMDSADSPAPPSSSDTHKSMMPSNMPMEMPLTLRAGAQTPSEIFPPPPTTSRSSSPRKRLGKDEGTSLDMLPFRLAQWSATSLNHRSNGVEMKDLLAKITAKMHFGDNILPTSLYNAFLRREGTGAQGDIALDELDLSRLKHLTTSPFSDGLNRSSKLNDREVDDIGEIVAETRTLNTSSVHEVQWTNKVHGPMLKSLMKRLNPPSTAKFDDINVQSSRFRTDSSIRAQNEVKVDHVIVLRYGALDEELQRAIDKVIAASNHRSCNHVYGVESNDIIIAVIEDKGTQNDAYKSFHQCGYFLREWILSILDLNFRDRASKENLDWPPLLALSAQSRTWDAYFGDLQKGTLHLHELQAFGGSGHAMTVLRTLSILEDMVNVVAPLFEEFYRTLAELVEPMPSKSKPARASSQQSIREALTSSVSSPSPVTLSSPEHESYDSSRPNTSSDASSGV